jgi:hypothetical protein
MPSHNSKCEAIYLQGVWREREKKGWKGNVADKRDNLNQDKVVAHQQLNI